MRDRVIEACHRCGKPIRPHERFRGRWIHLNPPDPTRCRDIYAAPPERCPRCRSGDIRVDRGPFSDSWDCPDCGFARVVPTGEPPQ